MAYPKLIAAAIAGMLASSAFALTPAEHKAESERIEAHYKSSKEQCKSLSGNLKDICEEEAKGQKNISKAELDYRKDPSEKHRYELEKAKADATYEVAKEKCDDLKGNAEDICEKDAKAQHVRELEAAKVAKAVTSTDKEGQAKAAHVAEVRKDAAEHVREADYKAAKEKCDTLAGDVKDQCINDAKRIFGQ